VSAKEFFNCASWPLPGHPEAMKMGLRQVYFHTRLAS
jgi:hypothetical protein